MNIKTILLLTVGMLWSTTVSYAQKVSAYGTNAEIDCREMKGVSSAPKGFKNMSTLEKSEKNSDEYTSEEANSKIFCRFEVAKDDANDGEMLWTDALKKCIDFEGGAKWRLPTHRELTLIMVMSPELEMTKQFTPLDLAFGYWSATVAGSYALDWVGWIDTDAWVIGKTIGPSAKDRTKKEKPTDPDNPPNKVRCIRELPL